MTTPALTRVEQAILEILEKYPDNEIQDRELRSLLRRRGFRRTAPALVFTMLHLEDRGRVICRLDVRVVDEVEIRERYYRLWTPWEAIPSPS